MPSLRVALIKPSLGSLDGKRYRSRACMEPLALAVLAGMTPPGFEIETFDDRYEDIPFSASRFDLVGITVGTYTAGRSYEIADAFRTQGTPVVLGGIHPTLVPEEAQEHADSVVVGEAEGVWQQVLEDLRRGELKHLYQNASAPDLAGTKPDRSIFKQKQYAPVGLVQFSRGCRYNCDFCSVRAVTDGKVRYRPVQDVVEEIKQSGYRFIFFVDDNIASEPEMAKELLRAIIPLRIRWLTQISMDFMDDPEFLPLMVKSGCLGLLIGLESLSESRLKQMRKGWSRAADYQRKLAIIRNHGIAVYGAFVFGYDGDLLEDIDRTLAFVMKQKLFMANFNDVHPYPGTAFYRRLQEEDRFIHPKWWIDPTYRFGEVPFHPQGMTATELAEGCQRARMKFHSYGSIVRRAMDFKANFGSPVKAYYYLLTNLASRQDILRKQGIRLGFEEAGADIQPA